MKATQKTKRATVPANHAEAMAARETRWLKEAKDAIASFRNNPNAGIIPEEAVEEIERIEGMSAEELVCARMREKAGYGAPKDSAGKILAGLLRRDYEALERVSVQKRRGQSPLARRDREMARSEAYMFLSSGSYHGVDTPEDWRVFVRAFYRKGERLHLAMDRAVRAAVSSARARMEF